jgi:Mg2+ and Co2+ transporter CorA
LLQRFLATKQTELKEAQRAKKEDLAEELGNIIARTKEEITEYEDDSASLKKAKQNLAVLMQNRSLVEHRIVALLRNAKETGTFRWVTSVSFCVLVLFVIAGFYVIAWYKDQIAYTIFSGEKGMQFITLFLIVIAIILFGIMGTLEGKELSALLGGLSGYILGRTSTASTHMEERNPNAAGNRGI